METAFNFFFLLAVISGMFLVLEVAAKFLDLWFDNRDEIKRNFRGK